MLRNEFSPLAQAIYQTLSPSHLRQIARDTGFVQRLNKLKPEDFLTLCSLLNESIGNNSLPDLCGKISYQSHTHMSKQALNERFNCEGVAFLKQVFYKLAAKQDWFAFPMDLGRLFSRIRIMDATSFSLSNELPEYPGAHKSGVKLQLEYEWLRGEFLHTSVHPETASDRKAARDVESSLQPGDLCLRDLGYYSAGNLKEIDAQGASYISRVPANTKFWSRDTAKKWINVAPEEDAKHLSPEGTIDYGFIRVGTDPRNSLNARVIVQKLTREQRDRRDTLLQKKRQKGKSTQSANHRNDIQILISNVPQEYLDAQAFYPIYSLRWQVEILFKTWKSLFKIDHVRAMKQERFECHLYGTLIRILLSSMMAFQCRYYLFKTQHMEGSEYKCIKQAKNVLPYLTYAISSGVETVIDKLDTLYENVRRHGKKEHRMKHNSPFDILHLTYKETFLA